MQRLSLPPGHSDEAFMLEAYGGECTYAPASSGVARSLVTAEESGGDFLICGGGGVANPEPVPFHYHNRTRHDFLCIRGQMKVWLNDQCRILGPGDYASVAPKAIHSYQYLTDHVEFHGIVVPGGWEKFFRSIGDIYTGPLWPDVDDADPRQTLVPRVKKAAEEFDVNPVPGHPVAEVQLWNDKTDSLLRGNGDPYFLRNGRGPSAVLGGIVVRPLATAAETDGSFVLGSIEGSSLYETQVLSWGFRFRKAKHSFYVAEGYITLSVDGSAPTRIGPTEFAWVPAGKRFVIRMDSRFAKLYTYNNPGGLVDLLFAAGKDNPHIGKNCMIPEFPKAFNRADVQRLSSVFDFEIKE